MAQERNQTQHHDCQPIPPFIDEEKVLLQSYDYIASVPGKNVRKKLTEAFNFWLEVDAQVCDRIADIVSLLHNASLLVDDIEDNSSLRRGVPTAHRVFGIPSTLNTANYVYFLGLEKCLKLGNSRAVEVFSEQMLELHRGQGMEIYYRDNLICPTVEAYELMVKRKTGGLFGLAVKMMQVFSGSPKATEDYSTLTALFGLYFQIRDDYENLVSEDYAKNKTFCEDLTEGKFSYPIIHAIRSEPADGRIISILRQRTQDEDLKKYAVSFLRTLGSLEHTRARLHELDKLCRDETERLGGNKHLICILDELEVR
ncbi:geranylgeranyl pyrophosphate synthase [Galendromus occidentalis]|uniref:Geranylgeranyl pyrophosphate synthase n=1 Tax=Galendromus occidentalis TaxID=34638 RepID=A0AAJ6QMZ5_9ACAR|nr:geranylgeranyl pyrophosphate synthase [Galendromus occidentalis]